MPKEGCLLCKPSRGALQLLSNFRGFNIRTTNNPVPPRTKGRNEGHLQFSDAETLKAFSLKFCLLAFVRENWGKDSPAPAFPVVLLFLFNYFSKKGTNTDDKLI